MAAHTGAKHHFAKLTPQQVRQARKSFATGKRTVADIARRYGVSYQCMYSAIHRKSWAHLK